MNRHSWIHILPFLWLLAIPNCATQGGSEVGNPAFVQLKVTGIDKSAAAKLLNNGVTLDVAQIVLSRLKFRNEAECLASSAQDDSGSEFEFDGPFVADLLTNTTLPDIGAAQIPAGTYCRIEVRLDELDDDEIPTGIAADAPIVGNSFYIEGKTPTDVPFIANLELDEDFRLANNNDGFVINDNVDVTLFMSFDLGGWFSNLDFTTAQVTGGIILINEDDNELLFEQLTENIQLSAKLFRDSDEDGELSDDESDDDDSLGDGED